MDPWDWYIYPHLIQGFITPGIGDENYRIYRGPPTCTKCTPPRPCREAMIIVSLPKSERWEKPCTSEMMGHSPPGSLCFPGGSSKRLKPRLKLEARWIWCLDRENLKKQAWVLVEIVSPASSIVCVLGIYYSIVQFQGGENGRNNQIDSEEFWKIANLRGKDFSWEIWGYEFWGLGMDSDEFWWGWSIQHKSRWFSFKYFLFSPLPGEMTHFDKYFSNGLKPPTRLPCNGTDNDPVYPPLDPDFFLRAIVSTLSTSTLHKLENGLWKILWECTLSSMETTN